MSRWMEPVTLEGNHIMLEPLRPNHEIDLQAATADGELWKLWFTFVPRPEDMKAWIRKAQDEEDAGLSLPFAVRHKGSGKVIGSTRYMNVQADHRRLEIGTTWYAKSHQRTAVNTECKILLLTHAYETLDCIAVEWRTHESNEASRAAILRLGAAFDGILRHHMIMPNGSIRNTAVYSMIQEDWPAAKERLEGKLLRYGAGRTSKD